MCHQLKFVYLGRFSPVVKFLQLVLWDKQTFQDNSLTKEKKKVVKDFVFNGLKNTALYMLLLEMRCAQELSKTAM